ncbi:TRAP transporter large permease [Neobacillus mesonae]|uniref:TRAP transporter large permease n=1 Tax=Neobacillus mesonae TaxID=1193713 RepID=UPI002042274C|nr:TRAP transporter large permease [Neobacillus mesonae]MCM3568480.1 TRAP transporter large permease [Neobacillus mesonae]
MIAILFITFFIMLLIGVPIAISLALGSIAALVFGGSGIPLIIVAQKMFSGINSFPIMAIPLFLLAGNIMAEAKISDKLVGLASIFVGRFRGGLAHVSTGASAFFGAISGSAPATTAAIGSIMIPSMTKKGYDKGFSAAVVAASGVLGLIIPPSLTMVLYGVTAGVSIGDLFIAGIVPGILLSLFIMVITYYIARKNNFPREDRLTAKEKLKAVFDSLIALVMPVIILGGIYSGAFTPTESAAVASLYGLIVGFLIYRNLTFKKLYEILKSTAENTAMIMFLIATASIFGFVIAREQLPQTMADMILGITDSKMVIMFILLVILLILGTFLDNVAAIVLVVPTLVNVLQQAQIDPLYFGIFMVIALAVGQITPPVGLNLFVASNIAKIRFESVVKNTVPYIIMYVFALILFIFFPGILTLFTK